MDSGSEMLPRLSPPISKTYTSSQTYSPNPVGGKNEEKNFYCVSNQEKNVGTYHNVPSYQLYTYTTILMYYEHCQTLKK